MSGRLKGVNCGGGVELRCWSAIIIDGVRGIIGDDCCRRARRRANARRRETAISDAAAREPAIVADRSGRRAPSWAPAARALLGRTPGASHTHSTRGAWTLHCHHLIHESIFLFTMGRLWLHLTLVASATAQTYTWPPQAPPPTPSPPWPPLTPALALLTVAATPSGACEVINGGACVTDGAGQHSNNERCTFTNVAGASLIISTYHFNVETGWDKIQMGGVTYSDPLGPQRTCHRTWSSPRARPSRGPATRVSRMRASPSAPRTCRRRPRRPRWSRRRPVTCAARVTAASRHGVIRLASLTPRRLRCPGPHYTLRGHPLLTVTSSSPSGAWFSRQTAGRASPIGSSSLDVAVGQSDLAGAAKDAIGDRDRRGGRERIAREQFFGTGFDDECLLTSSKARADANSARRRIERSHRAKQQDKKWRGCRRRGVQR